MHWNNPLLVDNYRDSSGLTLHMTPNLRPNEAGMMLIGQSTLVIPPGREKFTANSTCSSECTEKKMKGNIYLTGALNHMHYLGIHFLYILFFSVKNTLFHNCMKGQY